MAQDAEHDVDDEGQQDDKVVNSYPPRGSELFISCSLGSGLGAAHARASPDAAGMQAEIPVPPPGSDSTCSVPDRLSIRCRIATRPNPQPPASKPPAIERGGPPLPLAVTRLPAAPLPSWAASKPLPSSRTSRATWCSMYAASAVPGVTASTVVYRSQFEFDGALSTLTGVSTAGLADTLILRGRRKSVMASMIVPAPQHRRAEHPVTRARTHIAR